MMIDTTFTTVDWQLHSGDVVILPVGSVEQHDGHLPLETDCIESGYFARRLSEKLDAALLPVQPYANCLEHSGFRGSITLRPETLMHIIRDIADAVEKQGFRFLLVVNGHGGNFSLAPAIRDINRQDRRLKVLLLNSWEFGDRKLVAQSASQAYEIHAGEWETSVMMYVRPDAVRTDRVQDMEILPPAVFPLEQRDLNWCGVGHFSSGGTVGLPSKASPEKGQVIVEGLCTKMADYARDRIERMRRQPRYAGSGGTRIRALVELDIAEMMRLKTLAHWNQTEADWRTCLTLSPEGCFGIVQNGILLGTAVVVCYAPDVFWIGMVLVDPEVRRLGLGTRLMQAALDFAGNKGCIMLDAAPAGRPIYSRLGFRDLGQILRLTGIANLEGAGTQAADVQPLDRDGLERMIFRDQEIAGCDRSGLLRALYARHPELALGIYRDGNWQGFCLGREGTDFRQIGPVIAATEANAMALISASVKIHPAASVLLDVPADHRDVVEKLVQSGMTVQRGFSRMVYGREASPDIVNGWFACGGPEFG